MKIATLCVTGLLCSAMTLAAQDFEDQFAYTEGLPLDGQGSWTAVTGTGTVSVVAGNLTFAGYSRDQGSRVELNNTGTSRAVAKGLSVTYSSGTAFVSFLVNFSVLPGGNARFFSMRNTANGNRPLRIRTRSQDGSVFLGVRKRDGTTAFATLKPLALNTTYLVVASYEFVDGTDNDIVSLWIDPVPQPGSPAPPVPDATTTSGPDASQVNQTVVSQTLAGGTMTLDDLRFASSYAALESSLPVTLTSWTALPDGEAVRLAWQTTAEVDLAGFEVEHQAAGRDWQSLGFVEARGTAATAQAYQFQATGLLAGAHAFRLRQVDLDGSSTYSATVEVQMTMPEAYRLSAAYPNPFNPTTTLGLTLARSQEVEVGVYDVTGRQVAVLFSGVLTAGTLHHLRFEAAGQPSGLYLLRVQGDQFTATRRLILHK